MINLTSENTIGKVMLNKYNISNPSSLAECMEFLRNSSGLEDDKELSLLLEILYKNYISRRNLSNRKEFNIIFILEKLEHIPYAEYEIAIGETKLRLEEIKLVSSLNLDEAINTIDNWLYDLTHMNKTINVFRLVNSMNYLKIQLSEIKAEFKGSVL